MRLKDILLGWDFILSLVISLGLFFILPTKVDLGFTISLYGIGISVLSIVFSVYFAALAIIISSSDDDFVRFLDEDGSYSGIIDTFKFSLAILFIALIFSLVCYGVSSYFESAALESTSKVMVNCFIFLFLYGLFAALNSTFDSIRYSKTRTRFLKVNDNSISV